MNSLMKCYAAALLCLLLSASVRAGEEYRTFSDTKGRTFQGALMDFEAASEMVVLKRSDGKTGRMPLTLFSDADRRFIVEWGVAHRFEKDLKIIPRLKYDVVSSKESGISDVTKKVFDAFYEIRFINQSDAPFGKLHFEYCIFYNQGERDARIVQYEEGVCYGKGVVELLDPSSEKVSKTKLIRLYTEGGQVGVFGGEVISLANVRGIWLRIKTKLPSGKVVEREYRTSNDELWKWSVYSFGAGLNEGKHKQTYYFLK